MRRKLYAAIDLHSRTSVLGWMTASGEMLVDDRRFPTTEENLRREVKDLPAREIHLTIEACPLARWAAGILRPLVAELIVCDPRENRLIARSSAKRDEMDVRALCRLLRMGELHPVWMSDDAGRQRFREAVYNLLKMRDQQRELKALIKIRYQAKGILGLNGREIFHPEKRARWLEQLHREDRGGMEAVYVLFDTALRLWNEQLAEVRRLRRDLPEVELLQEVPGVGEVGASVFCAIIENPHRFQIAAQLYRYCGLAITSRSSDGKPLGYERLDRCGQRELKTVAYHAWRTGIRAGKQSDVLRRFYFESKQRTGTARHARLNTERKILKTLWVMWKNMSHFDPQAFLQTPTPEPSGPRRRRRRPRRRSRRS